MSDDSKMWKDAHARAVAEIARLRSVCREAADEVAGLRLAFVQKERLPTMYKEVTQLINDLADAGKEPSDGV